MVYFDEGPKKVPLFIRRLMPKASQEELKEATDNFLAYAKVVLQIHERLINEGREHEIVEAIARQREEDAKVELIHDLTRLLLDRLVVKVLESRDERG